MKNNKNAIAGVATACLLFSGCASFPGSAERPSLDEASRQVVDSWNQTLPIQYRENNFTLDVLSPGVAPDSTRMKQISIKSPGRIDAKDLTYLFDRTGIQSIISSKEAEEISFYLPSYTGDLGGFLDLISSATDLSFSWSNGTIIIDDKKDYIVRIAQQKDLTEIIGTSLDSLGAESVFVSKEAGTISYSASTRTQKKIANYLNRISVNTALIQIQLAVISVKLKDGRKTGFDWSSLSLDVGELELKGGSENNSSDLGSLLKINGSGAGLTFKSSSMSLVSALNMLSNYGESRATQNLTLQTLSGVPVSLSSGDKIPYIKDLPTVNVGEVISKSNVETEVLETGFNVEVEALYEEKESLVTISMNLELTSLIGMVDLNAGNEVGIITQPQTQNQTLNSIVKLEAGETTLLGGLIIESYSDNRNTLAMLENLPMGSQSIDNNQTAVFIMLRPTVTVFGNGNE